MNKKMANKTDYTSMTRNFSGSIRTILKTGIFIAGTIIVVGCGEPTKIRAKEVKIATAAKNNILLAEWKGAYGGVPAFDKMELSLLKPALETSIEKTLKEIDAIAKNPSRPSFENTIIALERSGRDLDRVMTYWRIWSFNRSSPQFREIQLEMAPKLAELDNKIIQNKALFKRIRTVYKSPEARNLPPDRQRLLKLIYDRFTHRGANLFGEARKRYSKIEQRLAKLYTQFANNVLAEEETYTTYLTPAELEGLPESYIKAAGAAAADLGQKGKYAVTNTRSSIEPFLTFSNRRNLREKVWRRYYSRGDNGDDLDNNALIVEILQLRNERVKLLGYKNYAVWRLKNRMAKRPERALRLLHSLWPAAKARVEEEVAQMQAIADAEGAGISIAPWDYRYYAEKIRKTKYALDSDRVKEYLQLDNLIEAMHFVAGELFNFEFTQLPKGKVPIFHEDVKVWEVTDRTSGNFVGLWYLDPFARPGKRSGAWAISYRSHESFDGKVPTLASNNSNFIKGPPGTPVLISWSDAETLFHEFGHALHALSSNVVYPTLNIGVRDYTEFQSQLLERWLLTKKVTGNYLLHVKTGESISPVLVEKIRNAAKFNQGFKTTEYLASAFVDMLYHTMDPADLDPDSFEREALKSLGMPDEIVMRHRSPHFGHIFSGEGYSAGYYSYIWADVLAADAAEAFAAAPGGYYDRELAKKLVNYLFAPRNSVDPAFAYRAFRGRDAKIDALMRERGFPLSE